MLKIKKIKDSKVKVETLYSFMFFEDEYDINKAKSLGLKIESRGNAKLAIGTATQIAKFTKQSEKDVINAVGQRMSRVHVVKDAEVKKAPQQKVDAAFRNRKTGEIVKMSFENEDDLRNYQLNNKEMVATQIHYHDSLKSFKVNGQEVKAKNFTDAIKKVKDKTLNVDNFAMSQLRDLINSAHRNLLDRKYDKVKDDIYELQKLYKEWSNNMHDSIKDAEPINVDLDLLIKDEYEAIEGYKRVINKTNDPLLLKTLTHILKEEAEHVKELEDAKAGIKFSANDSVINIDDMKDADKTINGKSAKDTAKYLWTWVSPREHEFASRRDFDEFCIDLSRELNRMYEEGVRLNSKELRNKGM